MSTIYAGRPGNETIPTPLVVTNATNATPIEIQTSAAHGLASGERVLISGVVGNAAANALAYIVVTDADKFLLYATFTPGGWVSSPIAGSGGYVSGGSVQPLGFATTLQLPSDGDPINAASVNNATEGEADREAWLVERTGAYRLVEVATFKIEPAGPGSFPCVAITAASGAWSDAAALNAAIDALYPVGITVFPGDLLEITATCSVDGPTNDLSLRVGLELRDFGLSFTGATTQTITDCSLNVGAGAYVPVSIVATVNPSSTYGQQCKPRLQDYGIGSTSGYQLVGVFRFTVRVWRAN